MGPTFVSYYEAERFYAHIADDIAGRLKHAVNARGAASLVCAGGSTPAPVYAKLATYPMPWAKIQITLSDERWVSTVDADSNEFMLRRRLLKEAAAKAKFVPLKTRDENPRAAQGKVEKAIAAMAQPFDVTLLGMGADGHIASLFPGSPDLGPAIDLKQKSRVCAVRAPGAAGSAARISLTLSAILRSRLIILIMKGEDKRLVYNKALEPGPVAELPVRGVLQQTAVPVFAYWLR
jgi:6-phosphogluconolactonase